MKTLLLVIALLLCTTACFPAQVGFHWDASTTPSVEGNPVKYSLYICTDSALTACTSTDVGTALDFSLVMTAGDYWVYATARNFAVFDGSAWTAPQESEKSNIVAMKVSVPAGSPKNLKIKLQ